MKDRPTEIEKSFLSSSSYYELHGVFWGGFLSHFLSRIKRKHTFILESFSQKKIARIITEK